MSTTTNEAEDEVCASCGRSSSSSEVAIKLKKCTCKLDAVDATKSSQREGEKALQTRAGLYSTFNHHEIKY